MDFHLFLTSRQSQLLIILNYTLGPDIFFNKIIKRTPKMIESPIRRKHTQYPKDFIPSCHKNNPIKRFTFNEEYQIQANSIKKYERSMEEGLIGRQPCSKSISYGINPESTVLTKEELGQDQPLGYHLSGKKPELNGDLLKRPRFSLNQKEEIQEKQDELFGTSMSPGCIRKQLQNRQAPLPAQDPCKIELIKSNLQKNTKISNSFIKFRSTGDFDSKRWLSSEKDVIDKWKESRSRVEEFPKVTKQAQQSQLSFAVAKEQYQSFRRKQESVGTFGKVNSLLSSMKKKDEKVNMSDLPSFDGTALDKLKDQINGFVLKKKGCDKKNSSDSEQSQQEQPIREEKSHKARKNVHFAPREQPANRPQLLVSYRSSLSYLKDLYSRSLALPSFHLVVKIPKLFNQKLIFKGQDKEDLYETARDIFYELKIPHENLVIKKYTNCIMLIARNICLIWHYDGRRYLGGWQTEYLDEGCKHGLGLQWQPKRYVYYGEYVKNKKHGLGVYKDRNGMNYIGAWNRGLKADSSDPHSPSPNQEDGYWQQDGECFDSSRAYQYL